MTQYTKGQYNYGVYTQTDNENDGISSAGSYAYPLKINASLLKSGTIVSKNTGANTMFYKVLGSNKETCPADDTDVSWTVLKTETSLAASTGEGVDTYTNYKWVWVGIKNNAGIGTYKGYHKGLNV